MIWPLDERNLRLLTLSLLLGAGIASAEVPPVSPTKAGEDSAGGVARIVAVAEGYLGALQERDWGRAYDYLSTPSKQLLPKQEWINSAQRKAAPPNPGSILGSLPPGADRCQVGEMTLSGSEARVALEATYSLPLEIFLAKEGEDWKIDLAASDRQMVSAMATAFSADVTAKSAGASIPPEARALLSPFIKSHRVEQVEMEAEKAKVKVVETAVVAGVLGLRRWGPFWEIVSAPVPPGAKKPAAPPKKQEQEGREWLPAPRHWRR